MNEKKTCRTCVHRERWECGSKIIQYCRKLKSNRTFNGLKKIKCNQEACDYYFEEKMNEILKKRIEEAAVEYAESIPQSDERKKYSREDFIAGAEYTLSNQWISVEEAMPEANENVLALIGGVPVVAKGYHVRARIRDISHWMPIPKFEPNKTE